MYLRPIHESRKVDVTLVSAKSRETPMKETTIPQLELLSNLLLARLTESVKSALNTIFDNEYFFDRFNDYNIMDPSL